MTWYSCETTGIHWQHLMCRGSVHIMHTDTDVGCATTGSLCRRTSFEAILSSSAAGTAASNNDCGAASSGGGSCTSNSRPFCPGRVATGELGWTTPWQAAGHKPSCSTLRTLRSAGFSGGEMPI